MTENSVNSFMIVLVISWLLDNSFDLDGICWADWHMIYCGKKLQCCGIHQKCCQCEAWEFMTILNSFVPMTDVKLKDWQEIKALACDGWVKILNKVCVCSPDIRVFIVFGLVLLRHTHTCWENSLLVNGIWTGAKREHTTKAVIQQRLVWMAVGINSRKDCLVTCSLLQNLQYERKAS